MIVLFTDYGNSAPYMGQLEGVLARHAPGTPVVRLFADAPRYNPAAAAYLLAAYVAEFPRGTVFLCVVDPGVGSDRAAGVLLADGRWYIGPDNGLFEIVMRRAREAAWWSLTSSPDALSATFHGRDWFAPVAAAIALGCAPPGASRPLETVRRREWPDDLREIIYIDDFGNAMSGVRATMLEPTATVVVAGRRLMRVRTFGDVSVGAACWYENANGLVEIAVNRGRASEMLGIAIGMPVEIRCG